MAKITGKSLTGTARYVSINSHRGYEVSRRDDLEAFGYVLVYLYTSSLPWIDMPCDSDDRQYQDIMHLKESVPTRELCEWCPEEFCEFIEYSKDLEFDQRPDYKYLKGLFEQIAQREGFDIFDRVYDWCVKAVTMKHFPNYYDFLDSHDWNPL